MSTAAASAGLALVLLFLVACGGGGVTVPTPSPAPSPDPTASPPPPSPTVTGVGQFPGTVVTSIQANCDAAGVGALINVTYSAKSLSGNLARVRLLDNGRIVDDSGLLNQPAYERIYTLRVPFGELHQLQVIAESRGIALGAVNAASNVQCAPPLNVPPGQRI